MWPWIKRWLDWAMHDLWPMHRIGPRPQVLHHCYEKAGLTVHDQAIPWNAEAVMVEAQLLRLPPGRRKGDFQIVLPGLLAQAHEERRHQHAELLHELVAAEYRQS